MDFAGCKAAFFCGDSLLTYLRDDRPDLPWPGLWDLPGGGRDGNETPEDCLLRELDEEFGLRLGPDRLVRRLAFPAMQDPSRIAWFFAGNLTGHEVSAIRFGSEGQRWEMMPTTRFLARADAVPWLQDRVRAVLA